MRHCTQCGAATPDDARFCPRCGVPVAAAASSDPSLGKVIADRYLLVEKIGQGGSGTIYRGEHTTLRKKVAVKVLHAQLSADDRAIERFRREATTVAELDNEHILQVLDFGRTEDQRLFFAMELLDGEPLTKLLERDKWLPVARTVDILMQIAEALMEAHSLGYVHRDLRPRNVFLTTRRGRRDFVKLLDFGLAKLILPNSDAKQTAMGMTFGDPRYMSPEQARGEALDPRSDIYSLGAIAFEMLAGAPPYSGTGTFEILQQHLDAPVPRLRDRRADCPEWLEAVVGRALAKQPDGRFATVQQLIACLRAQAAPATGEAGEPAAPAQLASAAALAEAAGALAAAPAVKLPGVALPASALPAASAPAATSAPAKAPAAAAPVAPVPVAPFVSAPSAAHAAGSNGSAKPAAVSALAASMGPPAAEAVPAPRPPSQTQPMQAPKPPPPAAAMRPAEKRKPNGRRAPASVASAQQSGSVDMTPASTPQLDQNVPSVVVESVSGEKTVPVRLAHVAQAAAPVEERAPEPSRKQDRPPTGEWFANESQLPRAPGYDDLDDEIPKRNRGPIIIGAVAGGLTLVGVAAIALLPKPHRPPVVVSAPPAVAAAPAAAPAAPASPPVVTPIAAAPTPAEPTPPVAAPPSPPAVAHAAPATPPPAKPIAAPTPKPAIDKPAVVAHAEAPARPVAKEPPAHVEKIDSKPKPATRLAVATTRPAPERPAASSKHDKATPDGFKDPFASEPAKSAAGESAQADFFVKLGRQKLGASDLSAAASNFNKAREYDPRSADAVAGLGEVAFEQGDYSGAAVHLKQALRLSPNRPRYLVLLGQAYYKLGKPKDAVGEYKKALRADPSNQEAQHSLDLAERKLQSGS